MKRYLTNLTWLERLVHVLVALSAAVTVWLAVLLGVTSAVTNDWLQIVWMFLTIAWLQRLERLIRLLGEAAVAQYRATESQGKTITALADAASS